MKDSIFHIYPIKDAENDGVLLDITQINSDWKKGIFSHITSNLLSQGYEKDGKINVPNLLDLLNQCNQIVKKKSHNFKKYDRMFTGKVEFPDGEKREVWMCENELWHFTIMLPEDY